MATDKKDIEPKVLSNVLLTEYVLKKENIERFVLDSRWNPSERFYDFIVTCKIALVIIALLNKLEENENYSEVFLSFEKAVFMDGDKRNIHNFNKVKSAMDKLFEIICTENRELDNLVDQNNNMPFTMACLRERGVLENEQAILHSRGPVIYMGWAMAWLQEVGITEENPVTLFQFSNMWIENYILINNFIKEFNPIKINVKKEYNRQELMQILEGVDFQAAAENIAYTFRVAKKKAASKGGSAIAKEEFLDAVDRYMGKPNLENALTLLEAYPSHLKLFEFTKDPLQIWARNFRKSHE